VATLRTLDGAVIWSRPVALQTGHNTLRIPADHRGTTLFTIRGDEFQLSGKVVVP
jgi:hypothetical protein